MFEDNLRISIVESIGCAKGCRCIPGIRKCHDVMHPPFPDIDVPTYYLETVGP
jgi:hypothetical protein